MDELLAVATTPFEKELCKFLGRNFRRIRDNDDGIKRRLEGLESTEELVYETVLTTNKKLGVSK